MGVMSKAALLAALVGACAASDVVVGTEDNFGDLIKKEGVVLAEFYAPWCGHCKKLAPEWEKAATELKGKATLVKVDATVESDLGTKYEVQGYPTIKAFIDGGDAIEYDGGRQAADIVSWVKKMSGPAVKTLADAAELEAAKKDSRVLVVGFFGAEGDKDAETYTRVAKANRAAFSFSAVYGNAALATAEGASTPGLIVYKQFDDGKDVLEKFDESFLDFVKASSFPLFDEIGPDNYRNYVDRGLPLGWLFVDPEQKDATEAAKAAVAEVAKAVKGKISMVWLSGVQYGQMAERVGLSGKVWPSFGIDDQGEHFAFDEKTELSAANLGPWVDQWAKGTLTPTVKSEEVPAEATKDGVTTIVGDSFKDIVYNKDKDVFVKFYAPWCGHCKSMIPAFEQLGKAFEDNEKVVIGKFDATANDAPKGFDIQGFPTLKLIKAGSNEVVDFNGGRDFDAMEKFIKENAASLN